MIAVDTSTFSSYLKGESGKDIKILDKALQENQVMLPPVVLTEILSAPGLVDLKLAKIFATLPILDVDTKYWFRVAETRRSLLHKHLKSRLGDACIAQSCLDHRIPLLTRDTDFKHYSKLVGLMLVKC